MYYVICASVSDNALLQGFKGILLLPQGFNFGAYRLTFEHPLMISGLRNIFTILLIQLPINIFMTVTCGYFLAAKNVMFKKYIVIFLMVTMFISGGLVPSYLNIRDLGLYNSLWALILPSALSLFNAIITKTAIEGIPASLIESAYIDGAQDFTVLFKIIIPLIKSTIAVLLLYYGVSQWNSWFPAMVYIEDNRLMPLQSILRSILIENSDVLNVQSGSDKMVNTYTETIKYSAIMVSTIPILFIYPFLQKYFTKGVMIGAVKG
jgi:putative aldouronate transport system permease protein